MIICSLTFNSEFGIGEIIAAISLLVTVIGGLFLYINFTRKLNKQQLTLNKQQEKLNTQQETLNGQQETLNSQQATLNTQQEKLNGQQETLNSQQATLNTQQETLNSQQATLNSQQATLNTQQETLNSQVQILNDQQMRINELQIIEQSKSKKADLNLYLKKAGFFEYDLIIDNRGASAASNVRIYSTDKELFDDPIRNQVCLSTPLEPYQPLQVYKIHYDENELSLFVQWDDNLKTGNIKEIPLRTKSVYEYENKLNGLYPNQEIPRRTKHDGSVQEIINDLAEEFDKYGPKL